MKPKNTVRLWFDKEAHEAARFYAATFPDSAVTAVHGAPSDYPSGKQGDVLTVEYTVLGIPCLGLNGGPAFKHSEAFSFQIATDNQVYGPLLERHRRQRRRGKRVRVVQRSLGPLLADHPARAHRRACGWRRRSQAGVRGDDDDEEDRHRRYRGGTARLMWPRGPSLVDVERRTDRRIHRPVRAAGTADSPARARDHGEGRAGRDRDDQLRHAGVQAPSYPRLFRGVQAPHRTVSAREGRCLAGGGRRAVRRRERQPTVPHRAEDSVRVDLPNREVQGHADSMNRAGSVMRGYRGLMTGVPRRTTLFSVFPGTLCLRKSPASPFRLARPGSPTAWRRQCGTGNSSAAPA